MTRTIITVYGSMDWFDVGEQPDSFESLPKAFIDAYKLWQSDADGNLEKIVSLLERYIIAFFIPHNIRGSDGLFFAPSGDPLGEIDAHRIRLVGVDFSTYPIPLAKAEALFQVPVTDRFNSIEDLETWQNEHDLFVSGVVFGWSIPPEEMDDQLDLMCGNHEGAECVLPVEVNYFS